MWSLGTVLVLGCAAKARPDAPLVTNIDIRGNRRVSDRAIKDRIVTTETSWWPFGKKRYFDPIVWEADLERIVRVYEVLGFYEARLVEVRVVPRSPRKVALVVTVQENEPVRVGTVALRGTEGLPDRLARRLQSKLPLTPGDLFLEADWEAAKRETVTRLTNAGYAEAEVAGEAIVDVGTNQARLSLMVRPGPFYRFGDIIVRQSGDARIPAGVVREQVRASIEEGDPYTPAAVEEAHRRVFAMGVFSNARVAAGRPDRTRGTIPVIVEVREAPFHSLRLGGGVGVDEIRQEVHLLAGWINRNFLGGLRKLGLQASAGWAFIPGVLSALSDRNTAGARNGATYRAGITFEQPRLFGRPTLTANSLIDSERTLEQAFDALGARTSQGVVWRPLADLTVYPAYQLQGYRLHGPAEATARTAPLALGCRQSPCFILLSYLEQILTWDGRDNPLEPRRGPFFSLSLQQGGGPLRGDFDYFRISPDVRGYFTFGEQPGFTLAGKLRLGTLLAATGPAGGSAIVTRFFSGGGNAMRGFNVRRLAPLLLAPGPDDDPDAPPVALPIGGDGLVEGNVEVRYPFTATLLGAGFADFATVTRGRLTFEHPSNLLWAVGVGLRYLTAIGPVRIDFAVRLPVGRPPPLFDIDGREITYRRLPDGGTLPGRERGDNVNRSCFGIGGSRANTWVPDGLCVIHISIGEAF